MKLSTLALVCGLLSAAAAIPVYASDNLVPEGSFEIFDAAGNPEGWKMPNPAWYKNFGGEVSVVSEEGDNFLRIKSEGMDKLLRASFLIQIPENTYSLRLSYRVRANVSDVAPNDGKGVGVMIARWWGTPEKEEFKWGGGDFITESTSGWQDKEFELEVPSGVTTLRIDIGVRNANAEGDFNDIVVEPIN